MQVPASTGPYRPVVVAQNLFFFSGQTGQDPQTGRLVTGGVTAETHRILQTLKLRLQANHLTLRDVVNVTIYLTDMTHYVALNEVYRQYFTADFPARTCVAVTALPGQAQVEITLIAARP
ncbi:hypothetical protein BXP70_24335 [Hymenobacter crusticola]|uniref:Reactive intermediate/imine deaminase n=1 Tax=Hymenobacter crusticola TaxID=1770526 RepID=A0A243W758_9BACT|nr:hypothetical protein BXP70_24335 [Hymenobacter crusticola]